MTIDEVVVSNAGSITGVVVQFPGPQGPAGTTDAGQLTGTLPVAHGGTGATTAGWARASLSVPGLVADNTFAGEDSFPPSPSAANGRPRSSPTRPERSGKC